jgi:hypothetical protein
MALRIRIANPHSPVAMVQNLLFISVLQIFDLASLALGVGWQSGVYRRAAKVKTGVAEC